MVLTRKENCYHCLCRLVKVSSNRIVITSHETAASVMPSLWTVSPIPFSIKIMDNYASHLSGAPAH